ncbi:hypothetical protein Micbo1qcDRAFT_173164 [Microdochium bolleyi]|uniref:Uncharacterized protein n=1 Tax=Microdochium bolleyi TaxID=196109 RepID=A0A136JB28_9PEZI|nr:hypothetical protein Micbo1qcDRAFT_173164 [Microdochium bolleyi]
MRTIPAQRHGTTRQSHGISADRLHASDDGDPSAIRAKTDGQYRALWWYSRRVPRAVCLPSELWHAASQSIKPAPVVLPGGVLLAVRIATFVDMSRSRESLAACGMQDLWDTCMDHDERHVSDETHHASSQSRRLALTGPEAGPTSATSCSSIRDGEYWLPQTVRPAQA